jgi:hypothetical protein
VKYMLFLIRSDEEWEALSEDEQDYEAIGRWWAEHAQAGHVVSGHELEPARTATTVRWRDGKPYIVDGPYIESKETIAGFGVIEAPDLDAALAIARTWPAKGHAVEIRPIVEGR